MKVCLLTADTKREEWADLVQDLYHKKISRYLDFDRIRLKSPKMDRDQQNQKIEKESQKILAAIDPTDFVVVCDERGKILASEGFSEKLVSMLETGRRRLVFVVGGAYGVTDEVKERADWLWSLSPMVMNHFVAQTVVLEQLYRGITIWKGIPYHNE